MLNVDMYAEKQGECDSGAAVKWCSPSVAVCPGKYEQQYFEIGGCYAGLAPAGKERWERLSESFVATTAIVTVYINQESTSYDSWVGALQLQKQSNNESPFVPPSLTCNSEWTLHNSEVLCYSIGGKSGVLRLKDAGGWTHAYQEVAVTPGFLYGVTGSLFAEVADECDSNAPIKWCSPSITVCPGSYDPGYYEFDGVYSEECTQIVATTTTGQWEVDFFLSLCTTWHTTACGCCDRCLSKCSQHRATCSQSTLIRSRRCTTHISRDSKCASYRASQAHPG